LFSKNGLFPLIILIIFVASLFLSIPGSSSSATITRDQFNRIVVEQTFQVCEEAILDKSRSSTEEVLRGIDKLYAFLKLKNEPDGGHSLYDLYGPLIREKQQKISKLIQLRKEEDEKMANEKRTQLENDILVNFVMNEKLDISAVLAKIKDASTLSPENPVPLLPAQTKSLYDMARDVRARSK